MKRFLCLIATLVLLLHFSVLLRMDFFPRNFNKIICQKDKSLYAHKKLFLICSNGQTIKVKDIKSYYVADEANVALNDTVSQKYQLARTCLNKRYCQINQFILHDLSMIPNNTCLRYKIDTTCIGIADCKFHLFFLILNNPIRLTY